MVLRSHTYTNIGKEDSSRESDETERKAGKGRRKDEEIKIESPRRKLESDLMLIRSIGTQAVFPRDRAFFIIKLTPM